MLANKLKTQLLFITLLPLLITIVLICAFIVIDRLSVMETEIFHRAENAANQASIMAEFPLYSGDISELDKVADVLLKSYQLTYIRFINSTGNTLIDKQPQIDAVSFREFTFPIIRETYDLDDFSTENQLHHLGKLEIGMSENGAESQRLALYLQVLAIALVALFVGAAFVLLFSRKLTNAIDSLMDTASRVERRDFSVRTRESGSGELHQFQRNFNQMIDSLQRNDEKLKEKIHAATASLNFTVNQLSEKNTALAKQREETIQLERSKAILEERERIMRDMHDGIGGQLVASLALLEKQADPDIIDNVRGVLSACLEDLRLIIHSFSMQDGTLATLLADFKYRTSRKLEQLDIQLNWQVDDIADELSINPQLSLHLLRILQEAFTNIIKHAKAKQIWFSAQASQNEFRLTIEDDGQFKIQSIHPSCHGIKNMSSRAQRLGGSLEITERSGGGCVLSVHLPLLPLKQGVHPEVTQQ